MIIDPPNRLDRRDMRAQLVIALVLEALDRAAPNLDRRSMTSGERRRFMEELHRGLTEKGVEVMTDWHRQQIGLEPRGPDGWTAQEIADYDRHILEVMRRPPMIAPADLKGSEEEWTKNPGRIVWVSPTTQGKITKEDPQL